MDLSKGGKFMNIMVFDTETINLDKPFIYNIGYVIYNTDTAEILLKKDYVVEQVWHNPMLFITAYYANKKDIYISRMRRRSCVMDKFGYITQAMYRDIKEYDVQHAFAYNSPFDVRAFEWNCDWFKCINPLILFKFTIFAARFIKSLRLQKHIKIFVMNTVFTPIVETTPLLPKLHISLLQILWILQKNTPHLQTV